MKKACVFIDKESHYTLKLLALKNREKLHKYLEKIIKEKAESEGEK